MITSGITLTPVFSTSVEVFPRPAHGHRTEPGLLHVRGGVSLAKVCSLMWRPSSPRPWRCFCAELGVEEENLVFSTSVEVFLAIRIQCLDTT